MFFCSDILGIQILQRQCTLLESFIMYSINAHALKLQDSYDISMHTNSYSKSQFSSCLFAVCSPTPH